MSKSSGPLRRVAEICAVGSAVALLFGAVQLGIRLPPTDLLTPHRKVGAVDYSADTFRDLAPLRSSFIAEALGERAPDRVLKAPPESSRPEPSVLGSRRSVQVPSGRNDHFASAEDVRSVPFTGRTNTRAATLEPGEPQQGCAPTTGTVWYRYAPARDGLLIATTTGSTFDTVLSLYTGTTLGGLTSLGCQDSLRYGRAFKTAFAAIAGRPYYFQLGGVGTSSGDLVFNLDPALAPPNDDFAGATAVSRIPITNRTRIFGATTQRGEPQPSCRPATSATIWYRYTPRANTILAASTFGSATPTVLATYAGTILRTLDEVACDMSTGALQSRVVFRATAGRTYYFLVDGGGGDIVFNLAVGSLRPVNDDIDHALQAGIAYTNAVHTFGSTLEPDEARPSCAPDIGSSVWYRFTAPETMQLNADTIDSRVDTVLAVYSSGPSGGMGEVPLGCSDDTPLVAGPEDGAQFNTVVSSLVFTAQAGQTYFFQVGIKSGWQGNIAFNLRRASE